MSGEMKQNCKEQDMQIIDCAVDSTVHFTAVYKQIHFPKQVSINSGERPMLIDFGKQNFASAKLISNVLNKQKTPAALTPFIQINVYANLLTHLH